MEWLIEYGIKGTSFYIKVDIPRSQTVADVIRWWKLSKYKKLPFRSAVKTNSNFMFTL